MLVKKIDDLVNSITMYRLVLYYLLGLLGIAILFASFNVIAVSPLAIIGSTLFLLIVCWATNYLFAAIYHSPVNIESAYITALILALIISPIRSGNDLLFLGWAAILSMASKYILAIKNKHLFNPAAVAVGITSLTINQSASWWVGTAALVPFILLGGMVLVRKMRRWDLVLSFFAIAAVTSLSLTVVQGNNFMSELQKLLFDSPLLFFAFVMLTEPITTPPTRYLQRTYAALVGFLFAPQIHLGGVYSTPEMALLVGNVFSYIVSPKQKLWLTLQEIIKTAPNTYDFIFKAPQPVTFKPGQYMEWTLPHEQADIRGNRRYFTIASSPTEPNIRLGVKFNTPSSSFKKTLLSLQPNPDGHDIAAGQLSGDFVLPARNTQKLVGIAGGIGITPFRSMIKYLLDTHQSRDMLLFYVNRKVEEIVYQDVLSQAQTQLGLKILYVLTDTSAIPPHWQGKIGRLNTEMIRQEVPDWQERKFYISGPHSLVTAGETMLHQVGVIKKNIVTDYFSGF